MVFLEELVEQGLLSGCTTSETTVGGLLLILEQIKCFQDGIRTNVQDNFVPKNFTSDLYIKKGETLLLGAEHLQKTVACDAKFALCEATVELTQYLKEFRAFSIGFKVSQRILRTRHLFHCLEESNASKDYLLVLDLLGELKSLICRENSADVDRLFQQCECFHIIQVKYHIHENILQHNLQQRFDYIVKFSEKTFPSSKYVTLQVSKDVKQLQNTVLALFQSRFNPKKLCEFLLGSCLMPILTKPVSVVSSTNDEYIQLNISYSLKDVDKRLRTHYKQVFTNVNVLFKCLSNINVKVSAQHVFAIIGRHIKSEFLDVLVHDCLMHAIPETMDEYQQSTLLDDVQRFEHQLADIFLINPDIDKAISNFVSKYNTLFQQRFFFNIMESARCLMRKDLQDMSKIEECNIFKFPKCIISKSALEIVKLMERILRQPVNTSLIDFAETNSFLSLISLIISEYCSDVPKLHEKLLESIPQQTVLLYNNCMFLAHWVIENSELGIPMAPVLAKSLQATGLKTFKAQEAQQQKILHQILNDFDISKTHSIGPKPLKIVRQYLRQLELLKNVWLDILPECMYECTLCDMINYICREIIDRILSLEDISATVARELSEIIHVILEKVPGFFKETHSSLKIPTWLRLQHLHIILKASLHEISELWCDGAGILTATYEADEVRHLIRAIFQNTDRRAKALSKIL